jgi:chaperonin GroES
MPVGVSVGDTVIFGQYGGNEIKLDGEDFLILGESDIFGVIQ